MFVPSLFLLLPVLTQPDAASVLLPDAKEVSHSGPRLSSLTNSTSRIPLSKQLLLLVLKIAKAYPSIYGIAIAGALLQTVYSVYWSFTVRWSSPPSFVLR